MAQFVDMFMSFCVYVCMCAVGVANAQPDMIYCVAQFNAAQLWLSMQV